MANDIVGRIVFLSRRSFAAVVMYETVIGSRPSEQGEKEVHRPAVYRRSKDCSDWMLVVVLDSLELELITLLASVEAAF